MLLNISKNEHHYKPIRGLNVSRTNEDIIKYLNTFDLTIPTKESVDFVAFNISEIVNKEFKKVEDLKKIEIAKWDEKFNSLPDELKDKYREDGYLPDFPPKPQHEEYYGVLIGEDIPNYLSGSIISYLRQNNIKVYFNHLKDDYSLIKQVETDTSGVYENINLPSGNKEHSIFLLY